LKKGIVHIIPLIAIVAVVGIGSVGVLRSGTINTKGVLASSSLQGSENSKANRSDNSGKNNISQDLHTVDNLSGQSKKSETPAGQKSNTGLGGSNNQGSKKMEVEVVDDLDNAEDGSAETLEATPTVKPGRKIRTNFPITINPETNEKTVTTPGGVKTIILPEVAIQNMIRAGFPVVLSEDKPDEGTPSASPEATPSGATESGEIEVDSDAEIQLTELDGELVYEIPAVKEEKFLGVVSVKIKVKGVVSAENGEIIKLQKSLIDSLLDLLSF